MTEMPLMFGPESSLVGVLTLPTVTQQPAMAFLMFNAGLVSRIGPHRFNVKLARALAGAGQASFRFDLSGRGDSRGAVAGGDFWQQSILDIRSAMDCLEQACGVRRFALVGICSGANAALATAFADPRVVGTLMFDGHAYGTRWTVPVRRWKRFRAATWSMVAGYAWQRLSRLLTRPPPVAQGADEVAAATEGTLPREEFVRQVGALVDRHLAVFFVFSGSWMEVYSYEMQFRDAFRGEHFVDKVRCDFRPDIDHTMISLVAQREAIDLVVQWVPEVRHACDAVR